MSKPEKLVLRNALPSDKPKILDHLKEIWGPETADQRSTIWGWLYERNPYLNGKPAMQWILTDEEKVFGVTFCTPARMLIRNEPVDMQWFGTVSVSPNMRGYSQAQRFARRMRDDRVFGLGFPLERTVPIYEKWSDNVTRLHLVEKYGFMVKLLRTEAFVKPRALAPAANLGLRAADSALIRMKEGLLPDGYTVERIDRFDDSYDEWFEQARPGYKDLVISMVDSEYLNWRYVDQPLLDYTPYLVKRFGVIKGFFVLEEYISRGVPVCAVVEHLAEWNDWRTFRRILAAAIRESYRRRVFLIKVLESYIPEVRSIYKSFQFVYGKSSRHPFLFYPPVGSDPDFHANPESYFICRGMADPKIV